MADILPPPPSSEPSPAKSEPPSVPTNELTVLADFIREHAAVPFDRHLATLLRECGEVHDAFAGNCQVQHWHDEFPCDEFERSISLGIAWLKARIQGGVSHAS